MKPHTILCLLLLAGCATYYQTNLKFNQEFETGHLEDALNALRHSPGEERGKRQFLYDVNNGMVLSLLGRYEESNDYFEKAFIFGEDYRINYLNEAASYLTNPNVAAYRGEDHEHLLLLYYKAINFLKLGKTEEALVECRRLNLRLKQLSDRYQSENKYRRDAFVHTLMGIIYDADNDYNNAFIAYRNALEIYKDDYARLFKLDTPEQLKKDLLRTAYLSGMSGELMQMKDEMQMPDYAFNANDGGELVFFWHNGLSPIKAEWGVNFVLSRQANHVHITNQDFGMRYSFDISSYNDKDKNSLNSIEIFRVAFPKYIERPTQFSGAVLQADGINYDLEMAEDVNAIAFKCLEERMHIEFSKALIRVAMKKGSEYQLRKENQSLGSLLGVVNALTEKADTRNWQTLPHAIHYSRIPLKEGRNVVKFIVRDSGGRTNELEFNYDCKKGQTLFHTFNSLESGYPKW
jgi:uncharacterized protein